MATKYSRFIKTNEELRNLLVENKLLDKKRLKYQSVFEGTCGILNLIIEENLYLARDKFIKALRKKLHSPMIYYFLGVIHRKIGKYVKAMQEFNEVISLDPSFFAAEFQKGRILSDQHEWHKALIYYKRLLKKYCCGEAEPSEQIAFIYQELGRAALALSDWERAIEYFKEVVKRRPEDVKVMNNIAVAYLKIGRITEGEKWLLEAQKITPEENTIKQNLRLCNKLKRLKMNKKV
ncbi:MAG TPA: tetratricopeptide repeat protein [candidate division WOR-3 bacterium]|uniref:Tetratricopeptide repeat protein n=1 Tax=candidate division WOR-3 bacterium TaxID=2052148 RepID=A0A9C9ENS2_UNCW3|nr:tetratricopeptide repeat protein [candidate division WOR-3 bacterium]